MHPASPAYSRSQRAIFSGVAVRAGIRMSARQDGPSGLPDYSRRDLAAYRFDNSPQKKLRVIDFFAGLERRSLTRSPLNQEKLQEKYDL